MRYGARMAIGLLTTAAAVGGCTQKSQDAGDETAKPAADSPARVQVSADTQQLTDSSRVAPAVPDSTP